jgi:peptide/nickel transport system substrate-binding protein
LAIRNRLEILEETMSQGITRRDFMKLMTAGTGGFVLAPWGLVHLPEGSVESRELLAQVPGTFPRSETLIARILTGRVGTPDDFNQWVGWKWQDRGLQNLADEPFWSVDFATGKIISGVADGDPTYSKDFTTLTVKLRKGVAWSDGQPFTSADVVYTVESLIKFEKFNAHSYFVDNVKAVTAIDDYTVKFELKQANSRFHTTFLDRWGCTRFFPKHIFEKQADPTQFKFNPYVGCGPYKLHSFDPQGGWTAWEKRADWDKSPTGILYGEPKPKYIIYQYFADESAQILSQSTHQLDVAELSADGLKALLAQSKSSPSWSTTTRLSPASCSTPPGNHSITSTSAGPSPWRSISSSTRALPSIPRAP